MYVWPAIREHVPGGGPLADRAICQQLEAGELLAELDKLDAADPGFEDLLRRFTRMGRAHFDFEERQVWPRLRAALPAKVASDLGRRILLDRKVASVLPHPARVGLTPTQGPRDPRPRQTPQGSGRAA